MASLEDILQELKALHKTQKRTQWTIVGFDLLILIAVIIYVFIIG